MTTFPEIRRAVALAHRYGPTMAATLTGYPRQTIHGWRARHGQPPALPLRPLGRSIVAALEMHGPMRAGEITRAVQHADRLYVSRALQRLCKAGAVERWGNHTQYTYGLKP